MAENPQDALDLLNKAVKIAPDNVEALANMATIYLEQGDVERAYSNAKKHLLLTLIMHLTTST
mgnify:CR=1 FL=1